MENRKLFRCVYCGGHHQVWCNGNSHITTYFSPTESINSIADIVKYAREFELSTCDCEKYAKEKNENQTSA